MLSFHLSPDRYPTVVLLIILSLAGGPTAHGQAMSGPASSPKRTTTTIPHRHFTPHDGLPNAAVKHLAQAPDGQLWIGTNAGLAVYDGQEIKPVPLPDSIRTSRIQDLFVHPSGTVWVSFRKFGVVALQHGRIDHVFRGAWHVERFLARGDTLLAVTGSGLRTHPPGADHFEKTAFTYTNPAGDVPTVPDKPIAAAEYAPDGTLWVLDAYRGLGRLSHDGTVRFTGPDRPPGSPSLEGPPGNLDSYFWRDVRFAADGTAVVSTSNGTYRFVPSTDTLRTLRPQWTSAIRAHGARIYFLRRGTVVRRNLKTGRMRSFGAAGLPDTQYYAVQKDDRGGLWIGSLEGLFYFPNPDARTVTRIDEKPLKWALDFAANPGRNALWMATWGSGIYRVAPTLAYDPPRQRDGSAFDVGEHWSANVRRESKGVSALSGAGWFRRMDTGWRHVHNNLRATHGYIDTTGTGVFWTNYGLCRVRPQQGAPVDTLWHWPLSDVSYHRFQPLDDGTLLLRDESYIVHLSPYHPDAPADTVAAIPQYADLQARTMRLLNDRVWLGTRAKGLIGVNWKGDTTRTTRLLPDQRVIDVTTVGDSLLLAGTHTGLYFLDPSTGTVQRRLTTADGLLSNTARGQFFRDTLYVGHPHGISTLPRSVVESSPRAPRPKITRWSVEGTARAPVDSARLAVGRRTLAFQFTGVQLARGPNVDYTYRLAPYDSTWRHTSDRRIRYTDLPPGSYNFKVRAHLDGVPTREAASMQVTLPRTFYETTWFRILCGLGVLALLGAGYRWRVRTLRRRRDELQSLVAKRTRRLAKEKEKTENQAERLTELDAEKNRFFANISHELRTPLTLLVGTLDDALDGTFGKVPAPLQQQLTLMRQQVHRMRRLTEQLLDLSRLETTEPSLDAEPRDLVAFLRRLVRAFVPLAERQGLDLRLEATPEAHPCRFDPEKLEKVVSNLLSNALECTSAGGSVTVRLDVEPSGDDGPPVAVVAVEDTGRGIPAARQDAVFERFAHGSSADGDESGTGIGLALARELTELHGGSIALDSAPGEGSTFTVRLPLPRVDADKIADDPDPLPSASSPAEAPRSGVRNGQAGETTTSEDVPSAPDAPHLLVVDDNAEVRTYLRRHLSELGCVTEADDGTEALEAARTAEPDLILTDVMMPELDGLALTRRLRADDDLDRIPVLLLTARAAEEDAVAGLEAGADGYVTKPFSIDALRARIRQLLAARRAWAEETSAAALLTPNVDPTPEDEAFLDRVTDALDQHRSRSSLTVEDLASEVGLSPRQLQRRLQRLTDCTAAQFIRRYRLDCAAQLLRHDAGPVSQIAYRVGFGTPKTFTKHFKDRFGCPPSTYAEQHSDAEQNGGAS